jgi:DNA mismatch endonuclease (patch repair protein)
MTDVFTPAKRKQIMTRIRSTNTTPEQRVIKILKQLHQSFRAYDSHLPGKPDIVIKNSKLALFVHGCFWHQHKGCKRNFTPKSNQLYWIPKLARNVERFSEVRKSLAKAGWRSKVIWECQTKDRIRLIKLITRHSNAV